MLKEVLISGFGGQGSLLAGQILALAGVMDDKNVTYRPVYGTEKRGGLAFCDVIISDEEIGSPALEETECLVAMDENSFTRFESIVRPGGTVIVNSSLVTSQPTRDDVTYVNVPCNEIAEKVGSDKTVNMVILGAYLGSQDFFLPMDTVEAALREEMGPSKEKIIPMNRQAMDEGAAAVK
ncbi:MAG: 2-oxoacid:acceptor oxidoreductase family protein [Firmicutes bacterium]|nr:2-oxoacid:acceptor oxidoreductase family protein [Bacillota bacterium]